MQFQKAPHRHQDTEQVSARQGGRGSQWAPREERAVHRIELRASVSRSRPATPSCSRRQNPGNERNGPAPRDTPTAKAQRRALRHDGRTPAAMPLAGGPRRGAPDGRNTFIPIEGPLLLPRGASRRAVKAGFPVLRQRSPTTARSWNRPPGQRPAHQQSISTCPTCSFRPSAVGNTNHVVRDARTAGDGIVTSGRKTGPCSCWIRTRSARGRPPSSRTKTKLPQSTSRPSCAPVLPDHRRDLKSH